MAAVGLAHCVGIIEFSPALLNLNRWNAFGKRVYCPMRSMVQKYMWCSDFTVST